MPNVFPISPKAFEFIKYTQVPVNKYTGIPNISIPIYTIEANGMNIPLTLDYHANGFRVSEEAGWTGLGWTLNGIGSIVQVVKGYDDFSTWFQKAPDEAQTLINTTNANGGYIPSDILSTGGNVNFFLQTDAGWSAGNYGVLNYQEPANMLDGTKDFDPDIFIFNMPGYSGEFYLNWKTNTFQCLTDKNILISGDYSGFRITTPDGNIFVFDQVEQTQTAAIARYGTGNVAPVQEVSSHLIGAVASRTFQLTNIYTSGGDEIDFNYVSTAILENLPSISQSENFYTFQVGMGVTPGATDVGNTVETSFPNNGIATTVDYTHQSFSYLSSIKFPKGTLKFNSSNSRTDFIGNLRLDSISLIDNNNKWAKSFSFNYDYFVGRTDGNNADSYLSSINAGYNTNKQPSEIINRLKLTSFRETGLSPFIFSYDSEPLPKKTSYATDYWGYYNNKLNNLDYMPNIYMAGITDTDAMIGINNNRNSTLQGTRAAVLNQIVYPTGGVATFDYELNTFNNYLVTNDNSSKVTSVFLQDTNNPTLDNTGQIFMADLPSVLYAGTLSFSTDGPHSSYTNSTSAYIRLTILKKTAANLALVNSPSTFWPMYNATKLGSGTQLSSEVNDVIQDSRYFNPTFNAATQSYNTSGVLNNVGINIDPANIYIVQAYLDDSWGIQNSSTLHANAQAYFSFLQNSNYNTSSGAGIRIKTVKTQDINTQPLVKSYTYSTGKLMSPLVYLTKYQYHFNYVINLPVDTGDPIGINGSAMVNKESTSSTGFYSISTNASGKYVGYDTVAEANSTIDFTGSINSGSNGTIVDLYTNEPDYLPTSPAFFPTPSNPYAVIPIDILYPPQKSLIENGLSLKQRIFDKNQILLQENTNYYSHTSPVFYYDRLSAYGGQYLYFFGGALHNTPYDAVGYYSISYAQTKLDSAKDEKFDGSNPVINIKYNYYDSYNQINRVRASDSKGNIVNTYFKHPYDFNSSDDGGLYSSGYGGMIYNNLITPVIETWEDKNGIKTFDTKTLYNFNSGSLWAVYLPQKIETAIGANPMEDKTIYDLYGNYADLNKFKLLQYHIKDGGVKTSILWGYQGQYPVAKVVGLDYNTAKTYINQAVLDNPPDDITLRTELNKINIGVAASGKKAQVTGFSYAPLIGVTSETDSKGYTTYYNYDGASRLSSILDKNKNYLKKYDYNYATPASTASVSVTGVNNTNTVWSVTISNITGTIVQNANLVIGSSTPFSSLPSGVYNITLTPISGSSTAYSQLTLNGINYSGGNFSLYNMPISSSSTFLLSPPGSYSTNILFTYSPGYNNVYTNFASNGSSVSFILTLNTNKRFFPNSPVLIGYIGTGGRPSNTRIIPFNNNGQNWAVTISPTGQVYLTLVISAGPSITGTIAGGTTFYYGL